MNNKSPRSKRKMANVNKSMGAVEIQFALWIESYLKYPILVEKQNKRKHNGVSTLKSSAALLRVKPA